MKNWVSQTPPKRLKQIHFSVLLLSPSPLPSVSLGSFWKEQKAEWSRNHFLHQDVPMASCLFASSLMLTPGFSSQTCFRCWKRLFFTSGVNAHVGSALSGLGGIVLAKKMYLLSADKVRLQGQGQVSCIKSGQMEERRETNW